MSTGQKQEVLAHVRWMIRRDMPEILAIENQSFEFPWTEKDFIMCLRQRNCIGMTAEHDNEIAGYVIYELNRTRIALLSIAVAEKFRRCRVGSQIIQKLVDKLSAQRRNRITLEVRESNLPAQLFFRSNGFRAVSTLHGYYADAGEDAYLMVCRESEEFGNQDPVFKNRIQYLKTKEYFSQPAKQGWFMNLLKHFRTKSAA